MYRYVRASNKRYSSKITTLNCGNESVLCLQSNKQGARDYTVAYIEKEKLTHIRSGYSPPPPCFSFSESSTLRYILTIILLSQSMQISMNVRTIQLALKMLNAQMMLVLLIASVFQGSVEMALLHVLQVHVYKAKTLHVQSCSGWFH